MRKGDRSPSCSVSCCLSERVESSSAVSSSPPKGIPLGCVLNLRIALNLPTHHTNEAKTFALFCITDSRAVKSKALAYERGIKTVNFQLRPTTVVEVE